MKIDFGCGLNKKEGYIGVDLRRVEGVDFVCDIEKERLPFDTESVDEIYTSHTLEHISNIIGCMNEFFRVLKWGGKLKVIVPDFKCVAAYQDPTHVRFWTEESMKYFCGEFLKKYQLDYGIICCFWTKDVKKVVPENKMADYLTELHFNLEKKEDWIKNVNYELLNKRIFSPKIFDPSDEFFQKTKQMLDVFIKKNSLYGNAFFDTDKYGEDIVFLHLERNWVKIREHWNKNHKFILNDDTENFLLDMANYCIMTMIRAEKHG